MDHPRIDEELKLLDGVRNVADLCAAPGGWSQVLASRLNQARIVAVDKYAGPSEPSKGLENG